MPKPLIQTRRYLFALIIMTTQSWVSTVSDAQELRKARIVEYDNGDRALEWVEGPEAGGSGRSRAEQRSRVEPRTSAQPVSKGDGSYSARGQGASGGGSGLAVAPDAETEAVRARPGTGVELIVGGQGKDGIAKKATVPVLP